jgi:hypothetical protein
MLHGCPLSLDAWGRLNVVTPFHHHFGGQPHYCPLGARPITASSRLVSSRLDAGDDAQLTRHLECFFERRADRHQAEIAAVGGGEQKNWHV